MLCPVEKMECYKGLVCSAGVFLTLLKPNQSIFSIKRVIFGLFVYSELGKIKKKRQLGEITFYFRDSVAPLEWWMANKIDRQEVARNLQFFE
jgi:hypothetical protein